MVERQRRAVLALFFVNGASFSSWLPRVPEVRDRLELSLGALGVVLVGMGLGGLVSSAVGGVLVDRVGSRRASVLSSLVVAAGLPLIGEAPSALGLAIVLVGLSAVDAVADIAMNIQGADVQRMRNESVMQRFHAAWSIGTVAGAGAGTSAAAVGLALTTQLIAVGAVIVVVVLVVRPSLSSTDPAHTEQAEGTRRAPVLVVLAALALAVAVVEGTPGDWAAVFNADVHGAGEGVAGLGYVAVAVGMVVGRLLGDRATDRVGARPLFVAALACVAGGLVIVVISPTVTVAIAGFVLCGLGNSVLFPALYLRAATTPGVPSGIGLGIMSSGARVGFLLSPLLVGALSDASTLRAGLGVVVGAAVVASLALGRGLAAVTSAAPVNPEAGR